MAESSSYNGCRDPRKNEVRGPDCEYFPCHYPGQDCTFCFCPFYPCLDDRFGGYVQSRRGGQVWSCIHCILPHKPEAVDDIVAMRDAGREMGDIFDAVAAKHAPEGKALMVLGATSDAGKSIVSAALCRILARRGFAVIPYKSQNMSLNSRVLRDRREISMIQDLQAVAAGIRSPPHQINPILMKPLGDSTSAVYVNGHFSGVYGVTDYYDDFVPGPGKKALEESLRYLKDRYDYVVMEGAGSPAEINIYHADLANMGAAREADASCILVVNAEWGGSFAYAAGTVALIPEEDRRRIKGIVINNVRGVLAGVKEGGAMLEEITGIPFLGVIPHVGLNLPKEDSECFRDSKRVGNGKHVVAVIRYPRISNFTDFDPLPFEDVTVLLVDKPEEIEGADTIILPGSKNPRTDFEWMVSRGIADAITSVAGKIPILGIGGGYAMMGMEFTDDVGKIEGLGLVDVKFDMTSPRPSARIETEYGDGRLAGYTVSPSAMHHGRESLFKFKDGTPEGYLDGIRKIYGTEINGIFDLPAFRNAFLRSMEGFDSPTTDADHSVRINESLDRLADVVEESLDIDRLLRLTESGRK